MLYTEIVKQTVIVIETLWNFSSSQFCCLASNWVRELWISHLMQKMCLEPSINSAVSVLSSTSEIRSVRDNVLPPSHEMANGKKLIQSKINNIICNNNSVVICPVVIVADVWLSCYRVANRHIYFLLIT